MCWAKKVNSHMFTTSRSGKDRWLCSSLTLDARSPPGHHHAPEREIAENMASVNCFCLPLLLSFAIGSC
ncbi:uncharacterized protein YALI1_E24689g [Yarrowia lipolytica]|uniref:Uncharacterized protein n=1 Tax=Yarrowia lipolytica TaxID=4952 RepID=A0A1D8NJA7_YARLL|nr:hypothetical protein YALI1_E24689g [Yarrowia lipolytica]